MRFLKSSTLTNRHKKSTMFVRRNIMKLKEFYVAYAIVVDGTRTVPTYNDGKVVGSQLVSCGDKFRVYKSRNQGLYTKIGQYYRHGVSGITLDELKGAYGTGKIGVPSYAAQTFEKFFEKQLRGNTNLLEQEISMDQLERIEEIVNKITSLNKDKLFEQIKNEIVSEQDYSL